MNDVLFTVHQISMGHAMQWMSGASREEVTCYEPGIQLFGWGLPKNVANEVATPMYARALVLDDGARPVALVLVDIGVITLTLRRAALEALRNRAPECPIEDNAILISATHTHSGPAGYSEYLFYGFAGPALSETVVQTYAQGIAKAIADAWNSRVPAEVRITNDDMPLATPIAFNRSLTPYLQNEEARDTNASAEEATRRTMTVLRVDRAEDRSPLGVVAWFATHATSIHSDSTKVHADHRGLAAQALEDTLEREYHRPVVAMFPQEASGDVTPNFRYHPKRKLVIGMHDDDHDSALFVAQALKDLAHSLVRKADSVPNEPVVLDAALRYVYMPNREVPATSPTGAPARLGDAVLGIGFIEGTREGPGPLRPAHGILRRFTNWMRASRKGRGRQFSARHGNKIPFLETGKGVEGALFGLFSLKYPFLPSAFDPNVATYKRYKRTGALDNQPWTPTTLPYQALRIGGLSVVTIPGEPTTMTGKRIRKRLESMPSDPKPAHIIVAGYANDYSSYVTTEEEYGEQWYEGSSTIFGPYTMLAMQEILAELHQSIWGGQKLTLANDAPPQFNPELYTLRRFLGSRR